MYQYRISDNDSDVQSASDDRCGCNSGCGSRSAKALKNILSQIDELNNRDLKILGDVVERLLCSRS